MIAIVDSGSTKSDWVVLRRDGHEAFRTEMMGLNPFFVEENTIIQEIKNNEELTQNAAEITHIFFYGAGCATEAKNAIISNALKIVFPSAVSIVKSDLVASAYAAYNGIPTLVCILGTGSNSCYFDGETIHEETRSLGFILGDEGSGNNLGKRLLQAYFTKKLPQHLVEKFDEKYSLTIEELLSNVYANQFTNRYLASFSHFVADYKHEPFIQKMVFDSVTEFFENQVLPYPEARQSELNFIGSISYYYEEIIKAVAARFHMKIGTIVRKPIESLVEYHQQYILPELQ